MWGWLQGWFRINSGFRVGLGWLGQSMRPGDQETREPADQGRLGDQGNHDGGPESLKICLSSRQNSVAGFGCRVAHLRTGGLSADFAEKRLAVAQKPVPKWNPGKWKHLRFNSEPHPFIQNREHAKLEPAKMPPVPKDVRGAARSYRPADA